MEPVGALFDCPRAVSTQLGEVCRQDGRRDNCLRSHCCVCSCSRRNTKVVSRGRPIVGFTEESTDFELWAITVNNERKGVGESIDVTSEAPDLHLWRGTSVRSSDRPGGGGDRFLLCTDCGPRLSNAIRCTRRSYRHEPRED